MKQIVNRVLIATLLVSFVLVPARTAGAQVRVTDDEIREILRDRIDVAKKSVGIVVGLVDDQGIRIVSYGKPNQNSDQMVNADSVFEIGSVTKVFTATNCDSTGPTRYAACVVLANTRLGVNKRVRKLLGVSKASFATSEEMIELTGMEAGGVTPFALPADLPIYVNGRVRQLNG